MKTPPSTFGELIAALIAREPPAPTPPIKILEESPALEIDSS
jgi:hypothetical protein